MSDDQVTSQKIKEADGTSGQNTNSGSGVKTNHIQNRAVTDAKIAGPISAAKISSTGLNADTVDGVHASGFAAATHAHAQSEVTGLDTALAGKANVAHDHDSVYQKKYANVVVVAKSGGDFTDPKTAMNAITDASAANPYLIKIMPGSYYIGYTPGITGKPFVDIEGSGTDVTTIHGNGGFPQGYVVETGANSEIRDLTIQNSGGAYAGALVLRSKATNIKILAHNGYYYGTGIYIPEDAVDVVIDRTSVSVYANKWYYSVGIWAMSTFTLRDSTVAIDDAGSAIGIKALGVGQNILESVTVSATGGPEAYGIQAFNGTAMNLKVDSAGWGVVGAAGSLMNFQNSIIKGVTVAVTGDQVNLANTQVVGPLTNPGVMRCFGVFDENLQSVACP